MASGIKQYPFHQIEPKWQSYWEKHRTFRAPDPGEPGSQKPKFYILDMFPYPSGSGLHVGHLEGYTATDIITRYKRMKGLNVLHPMGWDAFGLPAEQHALETGKHPSETTRSNIANFKRQIKRIGFSYDWDREINTTDPGYYKWTQWIFRVLYERGLAYEAEMPVNWCPALGTVLANEEVIDGKSERGGHPVIRKPMRQWVLKITAYAERLLDDLKLLDWPEPIKEMQRNWIGRSEGAFVDFPLAAPRNPNAYKDKDYEVEWNRDYFTVFTTRPDTLFGATYAVLSPEHILIDQIVTEDQRNVVEEYRKAAARKSDLERTDLAKEKTGVFTGAYVINPVNQQKIPIWIADYVLISYGTGAIMAVPAHDERDFDFAVRYSLPIVRVVEEQQNSVNPKGDGFGYGDGEGGGTGHGESGTLSGDGRGDGVFCFSGVGVCINSITPDGLFSINGMRSDEAIIKITSWLEQQGLGKKSVQYKLRDWLFSRQRYWGEPIPVIHVDGRPQLAGEKELPILLPETRSYQPTGTGESPLSAIRDWVETKDPVTGKAALRETNTMPQWAGSCWYYLRYIDPENNSALVDPKKEKYWLPVDLYVGGAEHAVLHLLYSRFWHKVLYDCGLVSEPEPFKKLINQGMILGEDNQKMSKSRGNVINPDDLVERYGADSIRLYEMFMGPLEATKPWSMQGVEGVWRFLGRVWRLFTEQDGRLSASITDRKPSDPEQKLIHQAVRKVTEDLEAIRLNTAISALMIFVNEKSKDTDHSREVMEKFVLLLAPFAPHIAEELWEKLGHAGTLAYEKWPEWDEARLREEQVEMAVLVDGKVRTRITVGRDLSEEEVREKTLQDPQVQRWIENRTPKQVIVVPGRIVNIVVQ